MKIEKGEGGGGDDETGVTRTKEGYFVYSYSTLVADTLLFD